MNEKIKQLAIQAGFIPWEDEPWAPGDDFDWSSVYDKELEEFAKLIIKECMRVCTEENPDPRDSVELQCSNRIKQHFGVE